MIIGNETSTQTIMFPAIGAGIYGWPDEPVAAIVVDGLKKSGYGKILICVIDERNHDACTQDLTAREPPVQNSSSWVLAVK